MLKKDIPLLVATFCCSDIRRREYLEGTPPWTGTKRCPAPVHSLYPHHVGS